jgi:glycosyltransferase involved in cell wall biosynthesis
MIAICPIRFGAGLEGKITEAMMHGLPVVNDFHRHAGMNARRGEDIMVGDTPDQIAEVCSAALERPALRQTLSRNGRDLVIRNYSFAAVAARLDKIISDLNMIPIKRYGNRSDWR